MTTIHCPPQRFPWTHGHPPLIARDDLVARLDRAAARKVTIICAPAGSGKTSLLRAWADRPGRAHRLAVVQVRRDQHDAQLFWLAVLNAVRRASGTTRDELPAATPDFNGRAMVDRVLSELAEHRGRVTLVIDDAHELASTEALAQLTRLLANLPSQAHAIVSTRRDLWLGVQMLDRQPGDVRHLLLRTCLLDRVNGELADLLTGCPGSERILLELEDANAFVVSLDPERTWFRFHQLFGDLLRLELRRTLPEDMPALHRLAAGWFARHGHVVEAIRHTQAAGDWHDAARLLADHAFSLTLDGQARTVQVLLRAFPPGAGADPRAGPGARGR
jgi:ATP/maltotriose-dependent transcriptional regulator MalT